ncbi:hypothetical protein [Hymenobacter guriensis]|nr:hypothetical protein [Hymenobacter guriensis]
MMFPSKRYDARAQRFQRGELEETAVSEESLTTAADGTTLPREALQPRRNHFRWVSSEIIAGDALSAVGYRRAMAVSGAAAKQSGHTMVTLVENLINQGN